MFPHVTSPCHLGLQFCITYLAREELFRIDAGLFVPGFVLLICHGLLADATLGEQAQLDVGPLDVLLEIVALIETLSALVAAKGELLLVNPLHVTIQNGLVGQMFPALGAPIKKR